MEDEIKKISIKEFRELELLAELNRSFLHPLDLALEIIIDDEIDKEKLDGIYMLYSRTYSPAEKIRRALKFIQEKHKKCKEFRDFVYQDIDNSQRLKSPQEEG